MIIILDEREISILKELLYRINLEGFKTYVQWELSNPKATPSQIRDQLFFRLEKAGTDLMNRKEELRKIVNEI